MWCGCGIGAVWCAWSLDKDWHLSATISCSCNQRLKFVFVCNSNAIVLSLTPLQVPCCRLVGQFKYLPRCQNLRCPPLSRYEYTAFSRRLRLAHYVQIMKPSAKPETHNVLHCRQRRTEPRPEAAGTKKLDMWLTVVFEICEQTETDVQTR